MSEDHRNTTPSTPDDTGCEAALELVPAYCLDATDPEERALVESRIADCPEVADEIAAYRRMAHALLFSAPPVAAPAHLREKLMAATAPVRQPVQPPSPSPRKRLRGLLAFPRLSPVLAVLAILLLVVSNLFWNAQVDELRRRQEQLNARLEEQRVSLALLGAREANRVELTGSKVSGYASMLWVPDPTQKEWVVLLYMNQLPPLPSDKTYQLWLIRGNQPESAGVYQTDSQGNGAFTFRSQTPIGEFDAAAITQEPAGGSPAPTTEPLVLGEI